MDNRITDDNHILNNRPPNLEEDFGVRTENDKFAETIMPDATDDELDNQADQKEKQDS